MKHSRIGKGLFAALAGSVLASSASAQPTGERVSSTQSGLNCVPASTADAGRIRYSRHGAFNDSNATATVHCGASEESGLAATQTVMTYDRHPTENVCCTMRVQDHTGGTLASAVRCSSGSFQEAFSLSWTPPAVLTTLSTITCDLPPQTSNGHSYVTAYTSIRDRVQ